MWKSSCCFDAESKIAIYDLIILIIIYFNILIHFGLNQDILIILPY